MSLSTASSVSLYSPGTYGLGTSSQQVDNVMCIGTESRLSDCPQDIHVVTTSTTVWMSCDSRELIVHTATVYEICYIIIIIRLLHRSIYQTGRWRVRNRRKGRDLQLQ